MSHVFTQSQNLKKMVEDLTTSGKPELNEDKMKILKRICKSSDLYILELFNILMKRLKCKHAEIRFSTFQICNEIFLRSHCFRELLSKNFKLLVELVIFHDPKNPPLKPLPVAKKLKSLAIKSIHSWHHKFKDGYNHLRLGYKYLKDCKDVDFESLAVITEQDRQRREDERRKDEEIKNRKILKVENDMKENLSDIKKCILEFNNTFKLLIPDLNNFFIPLEAEKIEDESKRITDESMEQSFEFGSDLMREHGLTKETTVQINLSNIHNVQETQDNEVIVSTLKEQVSNIKKIFLPKVKEWEQSIIQYSSSESELIRKIIDVKRFLEKVLTRYSSVNVIPQVKQRVIAQTSKMSNFGSDSSSDDDDFIDVPLDDPRVLEASASEAILMSLEGRSFESKAAKTTIDLTDLQAAGSSGIQHYKDKRKSPRKSQDLSVESFMKDKQEEPAVFRSSITGLTNIWAANEVLHDHEDDVVKPSEILGIATRAVDFEREWEPVQWECRAPLPTGRLCPRKDRECCPLHGRIVPRDNVGKPIKAEHVKIDQQRQEEYERRNPAWQDPTLLAEIKASTGVDLDMKKVKKRKKKNPNLTDIRAQENNPRNRLKKKVFDKKSMKRVNRLLAKLPP